MLHKHIWAEKNYEMFPTLLKRYGLQKISLIQNRKFNLILHLVDHPLVPFKRISTFVHNPRKVWVSKVKPSRGHVVEMFFCQIEITALFANKLKIILFWKSSVDFMTDLRSGFVSSILNFLIDCWTSSSFYLNAFANYKVQCKSWRRIPIFP